MQRKWMMILLGSYLCFTGCQVMPHAKGLQSPLWQTQAYQRQDQVEVQWKKQSFSFLLYQQQQGTVLDMVALSLTGQQLFKLQFDGQRVHVEQRIDQMRLLPFEFVVRDLLFATYPKFSSLGQQAVEMKQQANNQVIYIDKQPVLHIKKDQGSIELLNQQVPYSMTLSSIENTLQPQKKQYTMSVSSINNSAQMAVGIQFSVGLSALGCEPDQIKQALQKPQQTLTLRDDLIVDRNVWVGQYTHLLCSSVPDALQSVDSRNLRFALTALAKIETELKSYTEKFPSKRLAIVVGTSTSGISDSELLLKQYFEGQTQQLISHRRQEMSCLAKALQQYLNWEGPAYTISTACSSSAKALAAGQRLLQADLADAVLVGGVDTLCQLTLNGFNSLESLSSDICQPCGAGRDGINIGEAAAFFLLTKEQTPVMLMGAGESMDAWHISAPHPEGKGAAIAMERALEMANISAQDIGYLNLHGTATPQNDAMEIKAVRQVFGGYQVALSSTKHKTGHCLGAAGAIEAFICEQILKDQSWLPLHRNIEIDPDLVDQNYVQNTELKQPIRYVMSNSFAFGGSNISLVFGVKP